MYIAIVITWMLFGIFAGAVITYFYNEKKNLKTIADAEARGIQTGATLEKKVGWIKDSN